MQMCVGVEEQGRATKYRRKAQGGHADTSRFFFQAHRFPGEYALNRQNVTASGRYQGSSVSSDNGSHGIMAARQLHLQLSRTEIITRTPTLLKAHRCPGECARDLHNVNIQSVNGVPTILQVAGHTGL